MNERIRELAVQANGPNPFYGTLKNQMTLLGDDAVEKFAELIVKECMKAADEGMAQVTMKVEWPSFHIKKHFGVE
jgi:hypothetical protein